MRQAGPIQKFGVLNFVGWVIEIVGWIMVLGGFIMAFITFAAGVGAASGQEDPFARGAGAAAAGPIAILVAIGPMWAGLLTVAAGQVLRVLVVIANTNQETVMHLNHLRRSTLGKAGAGEGAS